MIREEIGVKNDTYLAVFREVNLESLGVVFKAQRCHGKEYVLAVNRFPLFLVAFLGSCCC